MDDRIEHTRERPCTSCGAIARETTVQRVTYRGLDVSVSCSCASCGLGEELDGDWGLAREGPLEVASLRVALPASARVVEAFTSRQLPFERDGAWLHAVLTPVELEALRPALGVASKKLRIG